jgi:hypothetical protein
MVKNLPWLVRLRDILRWCMVLHPVMFKHWFDCCVSDWLSCAANMELGTWKTDYDDTSSYWRAYCNIRCVWLWRCALPVGLCQRFLITGGRYISTLWTGAKFQAAWALNDWSWKCSETFHECSSRCLCNFEVSTITVVHNSGVLGVAPLCKSSLNLQLLWCLNQNFCTVLWQKLLNCSQRCWNVLDAPLQYLSKRLIWTAWDKDHTLCLVFTPC